MVKANTKGVQKKKAVTAKAHKPAGKKTAKPTAKMTLAQIRGESIVGTCEEVARVLRVHRTTVWRMVQSKQLPGFQVGDQVRIKWDDVEAFMSRPAAL